MNLRQKLKKAKKEIERLKVQRFYVVRDNSYHTQKYCSVMVLDPFDLTVFGEEYESHIKRNVKSKLANSIQDAMLIEEHTDIFGQKFISATIEIVVRKD